LTRNPYYAVVATFTVMGLWHAADPHWIIWGVWHGVGLAVLLHWTRFASRRRLKFHKSTAGAFCGWVLTLCYVALGGAFTALYQQAEIWKSFQIIAAAFGLII
jgi:D-alanyl-lipoteichoic acid acyltransferase DltB (MBOAT superfamily)